MDRCRVEYTMTRVAVLLAGMSDREVREFVRALDGPRGAPFHAAHMADWIEEWSQQHEDRAKLARDAARRVRTASSRNA